MKEEEQSPPEVAFLTVSIWKLANRVVMLRAEQICSGGAPPLFGLHSLFKFPHEIA